MKIKQNLTTFIYLTNWSILFTMEKVRLILSNSEEFVIKNESINIYFVVQSLRNSYYIPSNKTNSNSILSSLSFFHPIKTLSLSLSMNEQTSHSATFQNQEQMSTGDLNFLTKNQISHANMSDPAHNLLFYNSNSSILLQSKLQFTEFKEQQNITSSAPNAENYSLWFQSRNLTAPLNIQSNQFSDGMEEKADKYLAESDDEENEKALEDIVQGFQSNKLQKYLDLMNDNQKKSEVQKSRIQSKQKFLGKFSSLVLELQTKLVENQILITENQEPFVSIQVRNIVPHGNYQIIDLDVCVGKYEKNVKIYNSIENSCFHQMKPFNQGSFGSIYLFEFMGDQFIVKCVSKTNRSNFQHNRNIKQKPTFLKQILKQYMINCIAGVLGIGPKVLNPFGFDLMVSRTCIQFFIQKCLQPKSDSGQLSSTFPQLKRQLFNLHLLNIVHNDIKPQNIMYNKRTGNLCFIDFGLSELLQKSIGHQKQTKFLGTYKYASEEMKKLLFENDSGMIDLYYNDAYSLDLALGEMFQVQQMGYKAPMQEPCVVTWKGIQNSLNIIYLKFLIWKSKVDQVITLSNIISLKTNLHLQSLILLFIQKITNSSHLKYFYHQTFHESVKSNPKFQRIKQAYMRNIELELQQKDQDYKDFRNLYQQLQNMQHQIAEKQTSYKQRSAAKDQKKQLILGKGGKITDDQLWFLYIEFVNFLKNNQSISIQEKEEVSIFMMKKFEIRWDLTGDTLLKDQPLLAPIAQCLYYLLKESLNKRVQSNKIIQAPKLISLLMIIGWNISEEYLLQWRDILCLEPNYVRQKITTYLDFQIIQQIHFNRFFKFENPKSLKEIDYLIKAKKHQNQGIHGTKQSFYLHLINQRKRQNINNQTQQLLNIVIQLLQYNSNPLIITEDKLDNLICNIESLPHNLFKNKAKYIWIKTQLLFWVNVKYSIIRIDQEKQLKLLQKIRSLQTSSYRQTQLSTFQFQLLALYHNLKNIRHLKIQLEHMDQTINCELISENMCIPRRLMLSFMLKNFQMFKLIIKKIQKIRIQDISDINLLRHIAYLYQNIHFYSLPKNTSSEYLYLVSHKLQSEIKQFIVNFHQNNLLKAKRINRLCFAQLLRAIFGISSQNYSDFQNSDRIFSADNLHFYIKVLQNLSSQFDDIQLKTTYITEKMNLLTVQGKLIDACQFLEQQNHIKLSDFNISNYREASILINYYFLKINLDNDEKNIYINKLKEIYQELIQKKSYNFIFNNRKLSFVILNNLQNHQDIFHFFKVMTQHLTLHPSRQNVQILQTYLMQLVKKINSKYKNLQQIINFIRQNQNYDLQSLREVNQAEKNRREFFQQFYNFLKSQVNFKRLWQNPYMMMVIYTVSYYGELDHRQAMRLNKILCRNLEYLNTTGKEFILNYYYWIIYIHKKQKCSRRTNNYLLKKHFKVTSQTQNFEVMLKVRSNKENLLLSNYMEFPGQSQIRKNIYKYYDNLQVIHKINYFDNLLAQVCDSPLV